MENLVTIEYRVLRFSPNRQLGEWLNLGVIGFCSESHEYKAILSKDFMRIANTFGKEAQETFTTLVSELESYFRHIVAKDHDQYFNFIKDNGLSLAMGEQNFTLADDFELEMQNLFIKFVPRIKQESKAQVKEISGKTTTILARVRGQARSLDKEPVIPSMEILSTSGLLKTKRAKNREYVEIHRLVPTENDISAVQRPNRSFQMQKGPIAPAKAKSIVKKKTK